MGKDRRIPDSVDPSVAEEMRGGGFSQVSPKPAPGGAMPQADFTRGVPESNEAKLRKQKMLANMLRNR